MRSAQTGTNGRPAKICTANGIPNISVVLAAQRPTVRRTNEDNA